ncbi:MAG: hypothetical protein FWF99_07675, partial [Desulfovibrionaceae bacterium]|nr:hypothetical protein [Desulfovibrionaceae bacterium]
NLHKTQRIKGNMEKLASFGIIRDSKDFTTVFACDLETLSPLHAREYVREIRSYAGTHSAQAGPHAGGPDMENGLVEIGDDKSLRFFPPELKAEFTRLVSMKTDYFDLIGRFIRNSRMTLEEYLALCRARP